METEQKPRGHTRVPVIGANDGVTIEVVPGRKYVPLPPDAVPPIAVREIVSAGDGTWRWVAHVCPVWFPIRHKTLTKLGISVSIQNMRRLCAAGFIEFRQITPGHYNFNYMDYLKHEEATASPGFWARTEPGQVLTNRQRYSAVIGTAPLADETEEVVSSE
ncbi:hypothetical protein [Geminisphaera colitermitum]|uniref:hypothetical protein n=1 Tax=Geminisphaera colitermitum TaxID=1148786 RepID=UPI0005B923BF|nr:hypothetical protein [Geminisphaera colitermitum]